MDGESKRVIIADDSEAVVMYLGILMRRLGFWVIPDRSWWWPLSWFARTRWVAGRG